MHITTDVDQLKACLANHTPVIAALPFSAMPMLQDLIHEFPDMPVSGSSRFESMKSYAFISLFIAKGHYSLKDREQICILLQDNLLLFLHNQQKLVAQFVGKAENESSPGQALCHFFSNMMVDEPEKLEDLELQVAGLEEELLTNQNKRNYVERIVLLKKKLLMLRHYYTQLEHITEGLLRNENQFLTAQDLRSFLHFKSQVERLNQYTVTLRDYVTQVREAYQAQMDIQLNDVMKVLTVLTAIFSPLTLIVGWYGMNFPMPEYQSAFGYLGVIGFSLFVLSACLIYFRKKHWL